MTGIIQITIAAALILSIILPFGAFFLGEKNRKRYKTSLGVNCFFFFSTKIKELLKYFKHKPQLLPLNPLLKYEHPT